MVGMSMNSFARQEGASEKNGHEGTKQGWIITRPEPLKTEPDNL